MHTNHIDQSKALDFILAGNSTFTLKSLKTQTRFTYNVLLFKENLYFVKVLTGNDNENDYTYLAHIKVSNGIYELHNSAKSKIGIDAKSRIAFEYVFNYLLIKKHIYDLEIWHEGRCCRCGRKLTVPESIETGIGPECIKKLVKI